MTPSITFFINGIFTLPGWWSWTTRAVHWWMQHRPDEHAVDFYYFSDVITRTAGQGPRAARLAALLRPYVDRGWSVRAVTHSNGADVLLDALTMLDQPPVADLHLIAPACSPDCDKSGLNRVRAQRVALYMGGRDRALKLAGKSVGEWFGFGNLGFVGPRNAAIDIDRIEEPAFDHSDWFAGGEFDRTMRRVAGDAR